MKVTLKRITAVILVLFVLSAGLTHGKYATTKSQSIDLNITAAKSYTLTFDAHDGIFGTLGLKDQPETYEVTQYNNPKFDLSNIIPKRYWSSFKGWTTRDYTYKDTPKENEIIPFSEQFDVTTVSNRTLYAVWDEEILYNDAIAGTNGATIGNDDNSVTFTLETKGGYEKLLIPLTVDKDGKKLDPKKKYKVTFKYSGDAIFHNYVDWARNCFDVINSNEVFRNNGTDSLGWDYFYDNNCKYPTGKDANTTLPTDLENINPNLKKDKEKSGYVYFGSTDTVEHILLLNLKDEQYKTLTEFPRPSQWKSSTDDNKYTTPAFDGFYEFQPSADSFIGNDVGMYLFMEFSDIWDETTSYITISDVEVTEIESFSGANGTAKSGCTRSVIDNMSNISNSNYNGSFAYRTSEQKTNGYSNEYRFTIKGAGSYYERCGIHLADLVPGKQYTVSFDYRVLDSTENRPVELVDGIKPKKCIYDEKSAANGDMYYGYKVDIVRSKMNTSKENEADRGGWTSLNNPNSTENDHRTLTLDFTAETNGEPQYLWFNFSNVSDGIAYDYYISNLTVTPKT